jgi:hypothetical protein
MGLYQEETENAVEQGGGETDAAANDPGGTAGATTEENTDAEETAQEPASD